MKTVPLIGIMIVSISVGIVGVIFLVSPRDTSISAKEKNAAFIKILGREPILSEKNRSNAVVQYNGTYLRFFYPAAATTYPDATATKSALALERFLFQERTAYYFVVQVFSIADGSTYNDIPAIQLRRKQPTMYTEQSVVSGAGEWVTFVTKEDMFEKTAFLLHGGKLFSFSITGSDPAIENMFDTVVKSATLK